MNIRSFAAGAVVATALLAGSAAFAATDDSPNGDTAATDDRVARGDGSGGRGGRVDDNPTGNDPGAPSTSSTSTTSTSTTSTSTTSTSTTTTAVPTTVPGTVPADGIWHPVADVGRVLVVRSGSVLQVVSVEPVAPWRVVVERGNDREVEVSFRNGAARVDFNAELEDGVVRIRVRDARAAGTTSSSAAPTTTAPSTTAAPAERTQTFAGAGGTVSVAQRGSSVTLLAATPAAGWTADVRSSGPDKVEVRFRSGRSESRVEVEMDHGTLRPRVEDR